MKTFEFSVIASGLDPKADDFEARFYKAGCDDATISFQKGHTIVDFARTADTMRDAIASAIDAVTSTGAVVNRIEPDPLVSLSEIAVRVGMTRAAITQYAKGQRGQDFPIPVARITSDSALWQWDSVAEWMCHHDRLSHEAVVEAQAVRQANALIETGRHRECPGSTASA